jgi:hypothetical protein
MTKQIRNGTIFIQQDYYKQTISLKVKYFF